MTTPGSDIDHQEVLPNISTTHKEVLSVCQSDTDGRNKAQDEVLELDQIKSKCELYLFQDENIKNMLENAIEIMWLSEFIQVGSARIPQSMVRSRMHRLHGAILFYALDKMKSRKWDTQGVTNSTKYLISCIYNAITEYYSDAEVIPISDSMRV